MNDDDIKIDDLTIDLGDIHISGGSGTDYLDMSSYTYTTAVPTTTNSTYTISTGSWGNGLNGTSITSLPYITSNTTNPGISVDGDAEFKGSIKIKGKDLGDWMETLERRLAILVPDPKKLEQYEALQKAYKHYKMLEALCEERKDEDESK